MKKGHICPSCKEACIPRTDKYRAGTWRVIHCPRCNARLCANPILMALAYMMYFWAAAWFIGWAAFDHVWWPLVALIPVWLMLDFLNVQLMPLSVMRKKT